MKRLPPIEELRRLFDYDPETGVVTWKVSNGKSKVGKPAGSINKNNKYIYVGINKKIYRIHRICWALFFGYDPLSMHIDHINQNRQDNRIKNLRLVTPLENQMNKGTSKNNTSGVMGVIWDESRKKWRAGIWPKGKHINLGRFTNKADAISARKAAEIKYGFHENHGKQNA